MRAAVGQRQLDAGHLALLPRSLRIALDDAEVVGLGHGNAEDDRIDQ
jgi:hypothetical protein